MLDIIESKVSTPENLGQLSIWMRKLEVFLKEHLTNGI
jgi:hypothetical protein